MRTVVALACGTVIGLAAVAGVAAGGVAADSPAVVPFAAEAPDTPSTPTGTGAPPACVSPAPVKTYAYFHCYGPNEVRAAHGLPELSKAYIRTYRTFLECFNLVIKPSLRYLVSN